MLRRVNPKMEEILNHNCNFKDNMLVQGRVFMSIQLFINDRVHFQLKKEELSINLNRSF